MILFVSCWRVVDLNIFLSSKKKRFYIWLGLNPSSWWVKENMTNVEIIWTIKEIRKKIHFGETCLSCTKISLQHIYCCSVCLNNWVFLFEHFLYRWQSFLDFSSIKWHHKCKFVLNSLSFFNKSSWLNWSISFWQIPEKGWGV